MRRASGGGPYDAFLSYSHEADHALAAALQRGIERYAKRWNQMRALHVFRDEVGLSADPGLWSAIERALSASGWLIVLASPQAAASPWVDRELRWWLEHRSVATLLIVRTGGTLEWDDRGRDFDAARSTALPPALRGAFAEEPLWAEAAWSQTVGQSSQLNPAVQEAIVDLAATIRGIPKEQLVSAAVREHRRTMRLARGAQAGLALLLVLVAGAAAVAFTQRDAAREQSTIARSRQLAATATSELSAGLDRSQLLAVAALRTRASSQTRAALLGAVTASPRLVRYVPLGSRVVALAGSGDGTTAVAGLADGRVMRWTAGEPLPRRVLTRSGEIASLAVSDDGTVVAAADADVDVDGDGAGASAASLWREGSAPQSIDPPAGEDVDVVALSPSGRTLVAHSDESGAEDAGSLVVFDAVNGRRRALHDDDWPGIFSTNGIVLPDDDEAVLFDDAYGAWQRRRLADGRTLDGGAAQLGTAQWAGTPSADGTFFAATNGTRVTDVWRTHGPTDAFHSPLTAELDLDRVTALALDRDGRRAAFADAAGIHVVPVARRGAPRAGPVSISGNGSVRRDLLRFYGDGTRLLSAFGSQGAMWDLRQLDRLARVRRVPLDLACNACAGPRLALAPDGKRLAVMDGNGGRTVVVPLDGGRPAEATSAAIDRSYVAPVWIGDGDDLVIPANGWSESSETITLPGGRSWSAGAPGAQRVVAVAARADGAAVVAVDERGQITTHDASSGEVLATVPGPRELAVGDGTIAHAAVASASGLVAMVVDGAVRIVDPAAREVVGRLSRTDDDARYVAFAGRLLLVQRSSGALELWDERGRRRTRTLPGDETFVWPPVANAQGTLVARPRASKAIALAALADGATLATFTLPSGRFQRKTGVAFSPDGTRLYTVTEGSGADWRRGWLVERDLSDASLVRLACATAGRDLTRAEWAAFVGGEAPSDLSCR